MQIQVHEKDDHCGFPAGRTVVHTLAWWRSTPYIDNFLAFSRKCISASAGVIPLKKSNLSISVKETEYELKCNTYISIHLPVALVQLDHFIFQLFSVIRCKAKLTDIVTAVLIRVVVTKLGLHSVGAQQGKGDKGAGQPAGHDVIPQLQAEVVPARERHHCSHMAPPAPPAKEPLLRGRKRPSPKLLALARIKN